MSDNAVIIQDAHSQNVSSVSEKTRNVNISDLPTRNLGSTERYGIQTRDASQQELEIVLGLAKVKPNQTSWEKLPNSIHSSMEESKSSEQKVLVVRKVKHPMRQPRTHGFNCPPNPSQIFSWILAVAILVSFAVTVIDILMHKDISPGSRIGFILLSVLYALAYIGMVVMTVIVTASDPSDPVPSLERLLAKHLRLDDCNSSNLIVEHCQYFCNVCTSAVFQGSKHCSYCNRCTYGFDHHCRWVSNDIGTLNYASFIRMLIATISTLLLQLVLTITVLSHNFVPREDIPDTQLLLIINYVTLAVCIILLLPLLILFSFHAYLIKHQMSTLEFLKLQNKRKSSKTVTRIVVEEEIRSISAADSNLSMADIDQRTSWKQILLCCSSKEKQAVVINDMLRLAGRNI